MNENAVGELAKRCDRIVEVVDGRVPGFSFM